MEIKTINGKQYLGNGTHLLKVLRKGHTRVLPGIKGVIPWNGCWARLPKPKAY